MTTLKALKTGRSEALVFSHLTVFSLCPYNSVFECLLDTAQCRKLQNELCKIIDPEKDSLRFYYLGKKYENKIEHFGCKQTYLPEEPMIL